MFTTLKIVSKIQRPANPHGCWSGVYDFNGLFTTLIAQNIRIPAPKPLLHRHTLCKITRLIHIRATRTGRMVCQQLQRDHVQ